MLTSITMVSGSCGTSRVPWSTLRIDSSKLRSVCHSVGQYFGIMWLSKFTNYAFPLRTKNSSQENERKIKLKTPEHAVTRYISRSSASSSTIASPSWRRRPHKTTRVPPNDAIVETSRTGRDLSHLEKCPRHFLPEPLAWNVRSKPRACPNWTPWPSNCEITARSSINWRVSSAWGFLHPRRRI